MKTIRKITLTVSDIKNILAKEFNVPVESISISSTIDSRYSDPNFIMSYYIISLRDITVTINENGCREKLDKMGITYES